MNQALAGRSTARQLRAHSVTPMASIVGLMNSNVSFPENPFDLEINFARDGFELIENSLPRVTTTCARPN